jgi:selenocysteine lyase/cysteine desulfurase
VRASGARFINAPDVDEVIFVRGTTEAINLVAKSWGGQHVGEGDEIIVSHLEHHANIVPWQQLASAKAREAARDPGRRQRPGAARRIPQAAQRPHQDRGRHAGVERAGHVVRR